MLMVSVASRVLRPASFAARGATSEDADSTGHESQPAKPKDAPKLGHTWSERSQNSGSDRGTFGEQVSDRSDKARDEAAEGHAWRDRASRVEADLYARTRELEQANARLLALTERF